MRLPTPALGVGLAAGVALTAAVTATTAFSSLDRTPAPAAAAAAAGAATSASDPVITPLAAAVIPGPIDIDRTSRSNVVTVRIDFEPGDDTDWHSHPGPVLVQVVSGAVTLRHAAHGRCLSEVVRAGHGFFEAPGAVHNAANQRLQPAVVYATFVLPPAAPPEVSAPIPPACH